MKICQHCDTENADNAVQCTACGGNTFRYRCSNCGAESAEGTHCPHCGVKFGQRPRVCPVCRTEYYTNACPNCGYLPRTPRPAAQAYTPTYAPRSAPPKRIWLWVLGWIFIFPLPLTLILVRNKTMNKSLKIAIIVAAWVIYATLGIVSNLDDRAESTAPSTYVQATESTPTLSPTEDTP